MVILLAALAWAGCDAPVDEATLRRTLNDATYDRAEIDQVQGQVDCLGVIADRSLVLDWLIVGAQLAAEDGRPVTPWVDTVLRLDPTRRHTDLYLSTVHPLVSHWAGQQDLPRPPASPVDIPARTTVWVDGTEVSGTVALGPGMHLVQWLEDREVLSASVQGARLPADLTHPCRLEAIDEACAWGPALLVQVRGLGWRRGPSGPWEGHARVGLGAVVGERRRHGSILLVGEGGGGRDQRWLAAGMTVRAQRRRTLLEVGWVAPLEGGPLHVDLAAGIAAERGLHVQGLVRWPVGGPGAAVGLALGAQLGP